MQLGTNFDDIDSATIQGLIEGKVAESVYLEFKRGIYGKSDSDRKEFLKDVTAFANSFGGHLLVGIGEKDGVASTVEPLRGNVDEEMRRLESMARTGVEPKIIGLRIKRVHVDGGEIIVIHVPRGPNPPHRVIFKNANRYYCRNSAGAHEPSLEELRALFGQRRTIEERAKAFVSERFLQIQAGDSVALQERCGMVMHMIPLQDFGAEHRHEIATLSEHSSKLQSIQGGAYLSSFRPNLDGIAAYSIAREPRESYIQIFRHGGIEIVRPDIQFKDNDHEEIYFLGDKVCAYTCDAFSSCINFMKLIEVNPPIMLKISFFGIKDCWMHDVFYYQFQIEDRKIMKYGREDLHLPISVVTEYRDDEDYGSIISDQMHILWNAFGLDKCKHFDENKKS